MGAESREDDEQLAYVCAGEFKEKGCDIIQPFVMSGGLDGGSRLPGTAQIHGSQWHFASELQSGLNPIGCHAQKR